MDFPSVYNDTAQSMTTRGKMARKVSKAVIPVAGFGTRFLPATKSIPKEMIPIVDTPMIHFVVEEAVRSGITEIIFVNSRHKEEIENYFERNPELETFLKRRGKLELLGQLREIRKLTTVCRISSVRQKEPLGLGHAVLTASKAVGDEPFAVLLPDELIEATVPCIRQLMDQFENYDTSVIAVTKVPKRDVLKYGIASGKAIGPRLTRVERLIEKPTAVDAPSRLAITGQYVLKPEVFDCIAKTKAGRGGEIQLTDALAKLAERRGLIAYEFDGIRYDTGDRLGFIEATIAHALKRPELRKGVKRIVKKFLALR